MTRDLQIARSHYHATNAVYPAASPHAVFNAQCQKLGSLAPTGARGLIQAAAAQAQTHAHDAEDAVAFLQIAARIEIARAREIDIDDFLMIAKRCWPIGRRQPI